MPNPVTLIATKSPTTRRRSKKIEKKLATILSSAPPSHEPPSQLVGIWQNLTKRWFILLWCLAPFLMFRDCDCNFEIVFYNFFDRKQFFVKRAKHVLFFIYFCLFKLALQFLQQIYVRKCPYSKWCQESNSWPLEHESPPITTRPVLPPS